MKIDETRSRQELLNEINLLRRKLWETEIRLTRTRKALLADHARHKEFNGSFNTSDSGHPLQLDYHDALTGVPDRTLFMKRLITAMEMKKKDKDYTYAVLFINPDRFKGINTGHGYTKGDRLLIEITRRIKSVIRESDMLARIGGDEFALLIENFGHRSKAITISNRINKLCGKPLTIDGNDIHFSVSIGIVVDTDHYVNPEDVLRDADIAMYKSREHGRNSFLVFSREMRDETEAILEIESDLLRAFKHDEFVLYYHPIIKTESLEIQGFEALLRWSHPKRGLVPPADFIPVAEEVGIIIPIGRRILETACEQLKRWDIKRKNGSPLSMSVNVSARQLVQKDFVFHIKETLNKYDLNPELLRLELTETTLMKQNEETIFKLETLRDIGIKIALDDFGTGYSSLSYLHRFPVDTLKIDKSFIDGIAISDDNVEIVKSIINLAQNLGLEVVAEGVETQEQFDQLKTMACEYIQGNIFSTPLNSDDATQFILDEPAVLYG